VKQLCEFDDPYILITDHKISNMYSLVPILEKVQKTGRPLLIVADNIESDALSTLILNRLSGLRICAIKAPGFGDSKTNQLQDLAVMTNAELITEDTGAKLEDVEVRQLGTAKKIKATLDDTIILDGGGTKDEINERVTLIRTQLTNSSSE